MGYNSDSVANAPASDAPKKRSFLGENRNLWLVLGGLVAIAIVLVVGIVIVNMRGDKAAEIVAGSDANVLEEYKENFAYSTDEDIKPVLDWYKTQVDVAVTDEEKAEILKDEVYFLMDYDRNNVYGEEALAVARNLDGILEDSNSAIQVINIAKKYGFSDIGEEYLVLYQERLENEYDPGMDVGVEDIDENGGQE